MDLDPGGDPQGGVPHPGQSYRPVLCRLCMCRGSGNLLMVTGQGETERGTLSHSDL